MMSGRNTSSWVADRLAEQEDRPREEEFIARLRAHESVKEDWTEHHDDRPDDVREEVWNDPVSDVPVDATEAEKRFVRTRRIRRRTLRWKRGGQP